MPIKETGYCDYCNYEWCKQYGELTYLDRYKTQIVGNTFYILFDITEEPENYNWIEKLIIKKSKKHLQNLCVIPMVKTSEETIRDVLRSWNFNVKYKWLDDDLEKDYSAKTN